MRPRAVFWCRVEVSIVLCRFYSPSRVVCSKSPVRSLATSPGRSPISSTLPLPCLAFFPPLFPPRSKHYKRKMVTPPGYLRPISPPLSPLISVFISSPPLLLRPLSRGSPSASSLIPVLSTPPVLSPPSPVVLLPPRRYPFRLPLSLLRSST
jgi:hypothetical protein